MSSNQSNSVLLTFYPPTVPCGTFVLSKTETKLSQDGALTLCSDSHNMAAREESGKRYEIIIFILNYYYNWCCLNEYVKLSFFQALLFFSLSLLPSRKFTLSLSRSLAHTHTHPHTYSYTYYLHPPPSLSHHPPLSLSLTHSSGC